jgi:hypothetical protein
MHGSVELGQPGAQLGGFVGQLGCNVLIFFVCLAWSLFEIKDS